MPYRASETSTPKAPLADTGIVGDIIRQFADPLAFYRELVQNALDAGTTKIDVRLVWEGNADDPSADGTVHVSVTDDGEGMTRDILENKLLVLFRSGKEGQSGKIGKFGIGFTSVLALSPSLVTIHTTRPPDDRWTLELHPDLSYDLFAREGKDERGTTVTLRLPMKRDAIEPFAWRSVNALHGWCRHARTPVVLRCFISGRAEPIVEQRVDVPFDLDAPIKTTSRDGDRVIIVGAQHDARRHAGFFKHGLTLFETDEALVGPYTFKLQDPKLEHTLSRDNVRRDAAFAEALDAVRALAGKPLVEAAALELRRALDDPDGARWVRAALAVDATGLAVPPGSFAVPRITKDGKRAAVTLASLRKIPMFYATARADIGERAIDEGVAVIDVFTYGVPGVPADAVRALLERRAGKPFLDVEQSVAVLTRVAPEGADAGLLAHIEKLLAAADARVGAARFATFDGARSEAPCASAPASFVAAETRGDGAAPETLLARDASADPTGHRDRVLLFNVAHPIVRLARERARERPLPAAASLARVALLTWDRLDASRARALTAAALSATLPTTGRA